MAGGGWHPGSADLVSGAETALVVEYPAGLSKTGKPVTIKNWYHAVPVSAPVGGAPDVSAADLLTLAAKAGEIKGVLGSKGLVLGSKSGRIAGDPRVLAYYGNHQMPKGRRKKRTATGALTDVQLIELLGRELAGPSVPPLF